MNHINKLNNNILIGNISVLNEYLKSLRLGLTNLHNERKSVVKKSAKIHQYEHEICF